MVAHLTEKIAPDSILDYKQIGHSLLFERKNTTGAQEHKKSGVQLTWRMCAGDSCSRKLRRRLTGGPAGSTLPLSLRRTSLREFLYNPFTIFSISLNYCFVVLWIKVD
jgi:hypothetical protein